MSLTTISWFYADEFTEILPFFEDDPIGCPQSDDPHTADALAHETIPRGPDDFTVETAKQGYLDGGVIRQCHVDLSLELPS